MTASTRSFSADNCPVCGGASGERTLAVLDAKVRVRVACDCEIDEWEQREAERRFREWHEREVRVFFSAANVGSAYCNATLEAFEPRFGTQDALTACRRIVEGWPNVRGLVLLGDWTDPKRNYGNGKTHLGMAVVNALIARQVRAIPVTFPYLLQLIRATWDGRSDVRFGELDLLHKCIHADLLFIDDLGAEHIGRQDGDGPSWAQDRLFQIVDGRVRGNRPMLITSNLSPAALEERVGPRVWSRLLGACDFVRVAATDYRREKAGLA